MVAIFNLWNPYIRNTQIEFDVTTANLPQMKKGSTELIESFLNKLGIKKKVIEWKVIPFRSFYFTDYPSKNHDWKGRWTEGWMIEAIVDSPISGFTNSLSRLPVSIDATDPTWHYDNHNREHDRTALLIIILKKSGIDINSTKDILGKEIRKRVSADSIAINVSMRSLDSYYQLRILLKPVRFPDWTETGDQVLEFSKELGGIVNYRDLP